MLDIRACLSSMATSVEKGEELVLVSVSIKTCEELRKERKAGKQMELM